MKRLIIAIDGPSGAGKSTAGRALAHRLSYLYIDTGAMYRAVALQVLEKGLSLTDEAGITELVHNINIELQGEPYNLQVYLNERNVTGLIRTPEVTQASSIISAINGVRQALVERQRDMGHKGGIVMDGRDIGTHVFPHADLKFFLSADAYERARRRNLEEVGRGETMTIEDTLREIEERDLRDSQRTYAPLRPADDSIKINTSELSPEGVIETMLKYINEHNATQAATSEQRN